MYNTIKYDNNDYESLYHSLYIDLVVLVNQFGVNTCAILPLADVMVLETPVNQL